MLKHGDADTELPISNELPMSALAAPLAASLLLSHDAYGSLHKMKEGINDLPVEVPGLLNVLDEIAKVHVAVSGELDIQTLRDVLVNEHQPTLVVVLAFKAAYNMEKVRRDNDKRISLLYVAMKDMFLAVVE